MKNLHPALFSILFLALLRFGACGCDVSCATCISDVCTCQDGYAVKNGKCENCNIDGCKKCTSSETAFTCTDCGSAYYKNSGTECKKCSIEFDNCATCSKDSGVASCDSCASGYESKDGKCSLSPSGKKFS